MAKMYGAHQTSNKMTKSKSTKGKGSVSIKSPASKIC